MAKREGPGGNGVEALESLLAAGAYELGRLADLLEREDA